MLGFRLEAEMTVDGCLSSIWVVNIHAHVSLQNTALIKWQRNGKKRLFFSVLLFVALSPLTFALSLRFVPPVSVYFSSEVLFLQPNKCECFLVFDQSLLAALGLHVHKCSPALLRFLCQGSGV